MKLTGTNRPITYTTHPPVNGFKRRSHQGRVQRNKTACVHYVVPNQQTRCLTNRQQNNNTTIHNTTDVVTTRFPTPAQRAVRSKGYGGHSVGETPGPIPNPEAKTHSADGTAPGRVWESRSPPEHHYTVEDPQPQVGGPPAFNPPFSPDPANAGSTRHTPPNVRERHRTSRQRRECTGIRAEREGASQPPPPTPGSGSAGRG